MQSYTLTLYGSAFLIGLSAAAPIGPVNVEIIRRGLTSGAAAAFLLGCGAVSADCIYFGTALTAAGRVLSISDQTQVIAFGVSGAVLAGIGLMSIRAGLRPAMGVTTLLANPNLVGQADRDRHGGSSPLTSSLMPFSQMIRIYGIGLAMTLANPMTIGFWVTMAVRFSADPRHGASLLSLAGIASGALSWVVFIVTIVTWVRRWVTPRFLRNVNFISGAILIGFGVKLWINAIRIGS